MPKYTKSYLNPRDLASLHSTLSKYLFKVRDVLTQIQSLELFLYEQNSVFKLFCKNPYTNEDITLFCSMTNLEQRKFFSIVRGALLSLGIKTTAQTEIDVEFSRNFAVFLKNHVNVCVCLDDNTCALRAGVAYFVIAELEGADRVSQEHFLRSLCTLISLCGKNVSNNLDNVLMNEYGIINMPELLPNEDAQDQPLL